MLNRRGLLVGVYALSFAQTPAFGQESPSLAQEDTAKGSAPVDQEASVGDIIVTAQKRSQSINSVGMSITAASAETLAQRGITSTADLVKLVPGFTFAPTAQSTPVYTIRGIGLYESTLSASPAVAVYVDQVPLPFPIMTDAVSLDLERVEVLKGPQGTLFGQNSTGGAVNYIAAKPTSHFSAGGSASYERFGRIEMGAFVSGPLGDTLDARLAIRAVEGGDWQKSLTRPEDKLGAERKLQGRLLLDWRPTDRLTIQTNLNGFRDRSDTQAAQPVAIIPNVPAMATPNLLNQPLAPNKARLSDWSPGWPMRQDNRFWQASIRADYHLAESVTLTSVSSYNRMIVDQYYDYDGTAAVSNDGRTTGTLKNFYQEMRLSGARDGLNWLIGANYQRDTARENQIVHGIENSGRQPIPYLPSLTGNVTSLAQRVKTAAVFGNLEYEVLDRLTLQGAIRYTSSTRSSQQCEKDLPGHTEGGDIFSELQRAFVALGLKTTPVAPIASGQCWQLDDTLTSTLIPYKQRLEEDNLSWRIGVSYRLGSGGILYANASRGYKAGLIPNVAAIETFGFNLVGQERVDNYETGFKAPLNNVLQINGAAFYNSYRNKQVRASLLDPIFGREEITVNIPKSTIWGLESELILRPITGLNTTIGATYLNTEVTGSYIGSNKEYSFGDFKGSRLPYAPKLQIVADGQYEWDATTSLRAFVGASVTYHSSDNATFHNASLPAPSYRIDEYALLDLRVGISGPGDSWRLTVFGRNVTDQFYVTTAFQGSDTRVRYAGRPASYGISLRVVTP